MLEVLGEAAIRTLLLAGVVRLGICLFRIKQPRLLLAAWTVVLAASVTMPVLHEVARFRLPAIPGVLDGGFINAIPHQMPFSAMLSVNSQLEAYPETASKATLLINVIYVSVCAAILLRLIIGVILSFRLVTEAERISPSWAKNTHIRSSQRILTPAAFANVVLLPNNAGSWPTSMREAVLAHERAHVARWDFAMLLISRVNTALFWFNPLSWWLHRRLSLLAELVCDDRAMEVTGDRSGYVEVLMEMGRRSGPSPRELAMARPATLVYRIDRILSNCEASNPASFVKQTTLTLVVAGLSILAAISELNSNSSRVPNALVEQQQSMAFQQTVRPHGMIVPQRPLRSTVPPQAPPSTSMVQAPSRAEIITRTKHNPTASGMRVIQATRTWRPSIWASGSDQRIHGARTTQVSIAVEAVTNDHQDQHGARRDYITQDESYDALLERPTDQPGVVSSSIFGRTSHLSCGGVYITSAKNTQKYGNMNVIRERYYKNADGVAWLESFIGERSRQRVPDTRAGSQVELVRVTTTIFTRLGAPADRAAGTIQAPHGVIDYTCS